MKDELAHCGHCNQGDYIGSCKYGDADCPSMQPEAAPVTDNLRPAREVLAEIMDVSDMGSACGIDHCEQCAAAAAVIEADRAQCLAAKDAEIARYRELAAKTHKANMATNDEAAKLHEQLDELQAQADAMAGALGMFKRWGQQRCPCENEEPNPCPLCFASVENLETCKAVELTFPRHILESTDEALRAYEAFKAGEVSGEN